MTDYIYIINWEILRSGKVREKSFIDKEEYEEFLKTIIGNKNYKLLDSYKLDLEEL